MSTRHYKEKLTAFIDQEIDNETRVMVAEHLMRCEECRREHDQIRLAAALAVNLESADAPERVWNNIRAELDGRRAPTIAVLVPEKWFNLRSVTAAVGAIAIVFTFAVLVYQGVILNPGPSLDRSHAGGTELQPIDGPTALGQPATPETAVVETPLVNSDTPAPTAYWQFETLAGVPRVVGSGPPASLAVGGYLETDSNSRARIAVANIGSVEIQPNSRIKLVGTSETEHRLSLERGGIHAVISAPPRLFIVDTPSGKAVDLGCEYTLEVDKYGNSKLHVLTGFVALERGGRESWVPAGAMCQTSRSKGLGTPFSAEATPEFIRVLRSFDFGNGGDRALSEILNLAEFYDIITLWHLLSRVPVSDRPAVYDKLAKFVEPPAGVTRDGVVAGDRTMLDRWRSAIEIAWFE